MEPIHRRHPRENMHPRESLGNPMQPREGLSDEEHKELGRKIKASFPEVNIEYSTTSGLNVPYQALGDKDLEERKDKYGA